MKSNLNFLKCPNKTLIVARNKPEIDLELIIMYASDLDLGFVRLLKIEWQRSIFFLI